MHLTELREHVGKQSEKEAVNNQIKDVWSSLQRLDERRAQEFEEEQKLRERDELKRRREAGLHEIFMFYAKQHTMLGRKATFEEIERNNKTVNMGEFMKFCKDFKINLSKQRCSDVFKKAATNSIDLVEP